MPRVVFRLYAELNDHQPPDRRQQPLSLDVPPGTRVGEALSGLEVDPSLVGLVLVNGDPAPLDRPLAEDDRVAAYPPLTSLGSLPSS